MFASNKSTISNQIAPALQLRTLGDLLSRLPEELIIEILKYALLLSGAVARTQFHRGECEWPSCRCVNSDWKHIPAEKLTENTLALFLAASEPIPRLAQLVFYNTNTFHLCGPQKNTEWSGPGFWLPPIGIRHWIRHLEVEIQIGNPRSGSFFHLADGPPYAFIPFLDWEFLRRLQRGVQGFTVLRILKLMFEGLFIMKDAALQLLDEQLGMLEPFCFKTQELVVEACSAYPLWLDDDIMSDDIVRDRRLERALAKYMSATGKQHPSLKGEDLVSAVTL